MATTTPEPEAPKAIAVSPYVTFALRALAYLGKIAGLISGGYIFAQGLPTSWAIPAAILFGVSSVVKDAAKDIGDWLDDGIRNNSFKID